MPEHRNFKLFIGSCVWRTEETAYSQSMRLLERELDRQGIDFVDGTVVGDAAIDRARAIAASVFLRSDCDVLLSVDSDIWFRAQDAIKLCAEAMRYEIIAGLYLTRSLQAQPALMLPDEPVTFAADSMPVGVPFASTGFMAIHRRVFEKLTESLPLCHQSWTDKGVDTSFWPFYTPYQIPWEGDGTMNLSEDWAFCQRAKDAGFKIWLDPSIRLGHMATVMLSLEDLLRPQKPKPMPLTLHRAPNGDLKIEIPKEVMAH